MTGLYLDEFSKVTLIGDSITAGRGSSDCSFDGEYILTINGRPYYAQTGHKCYASILKEYLESRYPGIEVANKGCNGLNSNHVCKFINQLSSIDDTVVFLMIGANNRKLPGGMQLLYHDLYRIIRHIRRMGTEVVLLTDCPSTVANESRKNRKYHMPEVVNIVRQVATETGVLFVDCYEYLEKYRVDRGLTIEEFMTPREEIASEYPLPENEDDYTLTDFNRIPDGLHPPNSFHRLIAECIIKELDL